jgi:hypothetical protein
MFIGHFRRLYASDAPRLAGGSSAAQLADLWPVFLVFDSNGASSREHVHAELRQLSPLIV